MAAYASAGYLLPLEKYAQQYGWDGVLAPWAMAASQVGGQLVSLPAGYETMIMIYNPATVAAHGWSVPTDRGEFEAICAEAKAKGLMPVAAGNATWRAASEWAVSGWRRERAAARAFHRPLTQLRWLDTAAQAAVCAAGGLCRCRLGDAGLG